MKMPSGRTPASKPNPNPHPNSNWKDPGLEGDHYEIEKKDAGGDGGGDGEGWWDYDAMFELIGEAAYQCTGPEWDAIAEVPSRQLVASLLVVHPHHRMTPENAIPWIEGHLQDCQTTRETKPEPTDDNPTKEDKDEEQVLHSDESGTRLRPSPRRPASRRSESRGSVTVVTEAMDKLAVSH